MPGRMDEGYFDEKKEFALDSILDAVAHARDAGRMIDAARYELPNLTDPSAVHQQLILAQSRLVSARRDFEKSRWAAALTELEFEDWLSDQGYIELCNKV